MVFTIHFFPHSQHEFTAAHPHIPGVTFTVSLEECVIEPPPECFRDKDKFWDIKIRYAS